MKEEQGARNDGLLGERQSPALGGTTMHEVRSIRDLSSQISRDEILPPEFWRDYVWNKDQ